MTDEIDFTTLKPMLGTPERIYWDRYLEDCRIVESWYGRYRRDTAEAYEQMMNPEPVD